MSHLTFQQALQFAADYARIAEQMRAAEFHARANVYETASRAAFLRAHVIAKDEELRPVFGEGFRRAAYAVA
jgi:hypothetical protein